MIYMISGLRVMMMMGQGGDDMLGAVLIEGNDGTYAVLAEGDDELYDG